MKTLKLRKVTAGVALAISSTFLQAAPLDLDTSFDGDGIVSANYGIGANSYFQDVEITPDDKIVAVGFAQNSTTSATYDLLLVQYNLDGTLDSSFGTNGKVNLAVETNARGTALVIQPDGKILVTGHSLGSSSKWQAYVKRFNSDGSEDTSFAEYTYAPTVNFNGLNGIRDVYARDIALAADGKILVSVEEHFYSGQTGSGTDKVNRSRMIRLQESGSLDRTFGSNGFTDKAGFGNSYSYEDGKFALDSSGDIYVSGGRRELFYASNVQTMTLSKFNANGVLQSFDGSTAGWNRRENTAPTQPIQATQLDKLFSTLVLPNGNVVSAGCTEDTTYSRSRIQQQANTGAFVNTFGTNGVIDSTMSTQSQRIEHCYRDINYHPGVGLIAVGGITNGPFSSHGSLYVSAINETTGASIGLERLGTINAGDLYATATTSTGKIVSVGNMNNPKESVVIVMEGAPLPTPTSTLSPLAFTDVTDAPLSELQTASSNVVITPSAVLSVHVFGGDATINGSTQTSPFSVFDGYLLGLEHTSASTHSTDTVTGVVVNNGTGFHRNNKMWSVGDTFSQFKSTTFTEDTTPDTFSFPPLSDVGTNRYITSHITITGINAETPISISGAGTYSINGAPAVRVSGVVNDGDVITVRHATGHGFLNTVASTLTVGGVSATFESTTAAQDTTPDVFSFSALTAVELSTALESGSITVSGINSPTPISITNGEYRIGSGAYTSAAGNVNNGDVITLKHTSSGDPSTAVTSSLLIGGISADFTTTTEAADTIPHPFNFVVVSAQQPINTMVESSSVTISGVNTATPISVTNGEYSINGGSYTTVAGTVDDGDTVRVRHTTPNIFSIQKTTVLNVGGETANFFTNTEAQDTTPDAFSFAPRYNANLNASVQAGLGFAVTGINDATPISIVAGQYRIGNGAFTSANGMVNNGDVVTVRHTTSSNFNSTVTSTLTIGGLTANYNSTTVAQDTTPNAFSFTDAQGVIRNSVVEFTPFDVLGISGVVPISVTNGEYKIGSGTYTSVSGTVSNGDNVTVRHTNNSGFGVTIQSSLTIGTVTENFRSTTETADNTPDTFTFANQAGVELSTELTSESITISGINTNAPVTISAGEYSINGGEFTDAAGNVENGDEIEVRHTSAASNETATVTELTIGGVVGEFTTTTKAAASTGNGGTGTEAETGKSSSGGGSMGGAFLILSGLLFWRRRTK